MKDKIYELKQYLKKELSKKRYTHCINVAKVAKTLSKQYGVDEGKAVYAALAHDMAKEMSDEESRRYIASYTIEPDEAFKEKPNLAHGEIGAIVLSEMFGCHDEEILDAVRWHTYGKKGMGTLSKIIYMADVVESSRNFDGVEDLRQLVHVNLDEAILKFYEMSTTYLKNENLKIHHNTPEMIDEIKTKIEKTTPKVSKNFKI